MIRIAITGPESTGKSTLTENLARHFQTVFNPEYAREYIDKLKRPYKYDDIEKIAIEQLDREEALLEKASRVLFADTELLVIKVWMEHKYNKIPFWLPDAISSYQYDLYLLCDVDVPWEDDPQREHPHMRAHFFEKYQKELETNGFTYEIISGSWDERFKKSVALVDQLIAKTLK